MKLFRSAMVLGLVLSIPLGAAALAGGPDADPDAEALRIAERVTAEGAAIFDAHDAKAIAATYDEDTTITIFRTRGGELKREVHQGRDKVEAFYSALFKQPDSLNPDDADAGAPKSRNVIERARLLSPELLAIDGTFELSPQLPRIAFHQVRQNKDGKWLVLTMEVSLLPRD